MSNNRIYILHKPTGDKFLLCKYYTTTLWYAYINPKKTDEWLNDFNQWLEKHSIKSMIGNTDFELKYDSSAENEAENIKFARVIGQSIVITNKEIE